MIPMEIDENQPWSPGRNVQAVEYPVARLPVISPRHRRCADWNLAITLPDLLSSGQILDTPT